MTLVRPPFSSGQSYGDEIANSCVFNDGDSAYLSRTGSATPTDTNRWTASVWCKRGVLGTTQTLFSASSASNDAGWLRVHFDTSDRLVIGGWSTTWRVTNRMFRDPTAHVHIVIAVDTDQVTADDRIKVYVNGAQETSFATKNNPGSGNTIGINTASATEYIGREVGGGNYIDGYMAEYVFVDGQALDPTDFGEFDENNTSLWRHKAYSGTYGNNGFHLDFENSASLGNDVSGNGNDFTPTNLTSDRQSSDTPTNNHLTWNSIVEQDYDTLSYGNTTGKTSSSNKNILTSTFPLPDSGKWYFEWERGSATEGATLGIIAFSANWDNEFHTNTGKNVCARVEGNQSIYKDGSADQTGLGTTLASGDRLALEVDMDSGSVQFYRRVSSSWAAYGTAVSFTVSDGPFFVALGDAANATSTDGTLYAASADWDRTPTSGYKALCTDNLPAPDVTAPQNYADVLLYTGNGTAIGSGGKAVSGADFTPDLVAIKERNGAADWGWYDDVRGTTKQLESSTTAAETTESEGLDSFDAGGFTVGSLAQVNTASDTYAALLLKELTGFFDIVGYTGDGVAGRTVAHALGVAPEFMVVKDRDGATNWEAWHEAIAATNYLSLNLTSGPSPDTGKWNDTAPDASNITLGSGGNTNQSGDGFVAYLFATKTGVCMVGSYTGNGVGDGPFVWCGGRPLWLLVKGLQASDDWMVLDRERDGLNPNENGLKINSSGAESSGEAIDFLANGFKLRTTSGNVNTSGHDYIFVAILDGAFGGQGVPPMTAH